MTQNGTKRLIALHQSLHTLGRTWQHQLESNINNSGRHVRERDPEKLGIPAGAVPGTWVGSSQSVLHAVRHLAEISVTDSIHDQTLDIDV